MLFDFIKEAYELQESEIINEQTLNEDKVVKFGGEVYPKFGWCLILMGGSAAGKGTVFDKLVPFQGRYYNPDSLKEIERMWDITNSTHTQDMNNNTPPTNLKYRDSFETPSEQYQETDENGNLLFKTSKSNQAKTVVMDGNEFYYTHKDSHSGDFVIDEPYDGDKGQLVPIIKDKYRNLKNAKFADELHLKFDDLSTEWKNQMANIANNAEEKGYPINPERLPNMVFDITGKKFKKVDKLVQTVKAQGYKVAIVMVLTTANRAIKNNAKRSRSISNEIVIPAHLGAMETMNNIIHSDYINNIDDFWVVDTAVSQATFEDGKAYHDAQNVYHMNPKEGEMSEEKFKQIMDKIDRRVAYNKKNFNKALDNLDTPPV